MFNAKIVHAAHVGSDCSHEVLRHEARMGNDIFQHVVISRSIADEVRWLVVLHVVLSSLVAWSNLVGRSISDAVRWLIVAYIVLTSLVSWSINVDNGLNDDAVQGLHFRLQHLRLPGVLFESTCYGMFLLVVRYVGVHVLGVHVLDALGLDFLD